MKMDYVSVLVHFLPLLDLVLQHRKNSQVLQLKEGFLTIPSIIHAGQRITP